MLRIREGRSLSQDVEFGVGKEWSLPEDNDCVEDKGRSLPEDVKYGVEKE